ncbi:GAF domain-containing sensor histidine kinase [Nostoc sp. NIES-2111]
MRSAFQSVGLTTLAFRTSTDLLRKLSDLLILIARHASTASERLRAPASEHGVGASMLPAKGKTESAQLQVNRTITRVLNALAAESNISKALEHVLLAMTEHLDSSTAALWTFDSESNCFDLKLAQSPGGLLVKSPFDDPVLAETWMPLRDLIFKAHIVQRQPFVYHPNSEDLSFRDRLLMQRLGIRTLLGIPIIIGDELIGGFTARFTEERIFSSYDLDLAQAIAHHTALAMHLVSLGETACKLAVFNERARLARDIHDTLAQGFHAIHAHLQIVDVDISEYSARHIRAAQKLARDNLRVARHCVWRLRPLELLQRSFPDALKMLAKRVEADAAVLVELFIPEDRLAMKQGETEEEIFRIVQEALSNCIKHALATRIQIELCRINGSRVRLTIRDDGKGFVMKEPNAAIAEDPDGGGFGLTSMAERACRVGAALQVTSEPGKGTEVTVAWLNASPLPD